MKINNVRVEADPNTFAPIIKFDGQIEMKPMQDNIAKGGKTEEKFIAEMGADLVAQLKEQLAQ